MSLNKHHVPFTDLQGHNLLCSSEQKMKFPLFLTVCLSSYEKNIWLAILPVPSEVCALMRTGVQWGVGLGRGGHVHRGNLWHLCVKNWGVLVAWLLAGGCSLHVDLLWVAEAVFENAASEYLSHNQVQQPLQAKPSREKGDHVIV